MILQPQIMPHPDIIGDYLVQKDFVYEWEAEGNVTIGNSDFNISSISGVRCVFNSPVI